MNRKAYAVFSIIILVSLALGACSSPDTAPISSPATAATVAPTTTSATAQATATPPALAQGQALPQSFSGQEAYRHIQYLAETIGSRPTGTSQEQAAADYIAGQLRGYGYRVEQQRFEFEHYDDRGGSLALLTPSTNSIANHTLASSPTGDVTGALVAAGIGRPEDFPPQGLAGQIALVERGTLRFSEKVANAANAGAVGVVVYNNVSGEFRGSLGEQGSIPVVGITQEDGQRLMALLQQGQVTVHLKVDAGQRVIQSQNVVAKTGDTCRVIVGGHYDSVPEGPGANDNASGTATAMEVARGMRGQAEAQGLCFVAFGGEELGLWGSRKFVEALSEDARSKLVAMINLDMVGVGDRWRITGSTNLQDLTSTVSQGLGIEVRPFEGSTRAGGGSDHAPFLAAGIPAVFIHRLDDPNYHTTNDTAEHVDPAALEAASRMVVGMLNQLATAR